jgi:hypothetical protein
VNHRFFDRLILVCIIIYTLILCANWYGQSYLLSTILNYTENSINGIFAFEFIIKLIAMRKLYFKDRWNIYDLFITTSMTTGSILSLSSNSSIRSMNQIILAFRIGRALRLLSTNRYLSKMYMSFINAA